MKKKDIKQWGREGTRIQCMTSFESVSTSIVRVNIKIRIDQLANADRKSGFSLIQTHAQCSYT